MKHAFKSLLLIAALAAYALPAQAQVESSALQYGLSNATWIGEVATTNLINANVVNLTPGRGIALSCILVGTNATCTTNIMLQFATSVDGTNYATETKSLLPVIITPNGTTAVYTYTNFPAAVLDNARKLKCVTITNANFVLADGFWISNLVFSTGQ